MLPIQCQIKNLNHPGLVTPGYRGLVAGMCGELKIAEYIDARIPDDSEARNVTIGQAVQAMVHNGLGL